MSITNAFVLLFWDISKYCCILGHAKVVNSRRFYYASLPVSFSLSICVFLTQWGMTSTEWIHSSQRTDKHIFFADNRHDQLQYISYF